jgi:predicted dehydrogenase
MEKSEFGFDVVGMDVIAGVIADAIVKSQNAQLIAVSSRQIEHAQDFVTNRQGVAAVQGAHTLLSRADIDAVYIAVPTAAKEEIALSAIAAGKHVLVDKPFIDYASLFRIAEAAAVKGVAFMDATHFVHHPRTAAVRAACTEKIGSPDPSTRPFTFHSRSFQHPLRSQTRTNGSAGGSGVVFDAGGSSIFAPKG